MRKIIYLTIGIVVPFLGSSCRNDSTSKAANMDVKKKTENTLKDQPISKHQTQKPNLSQSKVKAPEEKSKLTMDTPKVNDRLLLSEDTTPDPSQKEVKKVIKPSSYVKHKGRSYPVYERRQPAPENLSDKEIELHERKQDIRMIFAEARAAGMKNFRNYTDIVATKQGQVAMIKKEIRKLEEELGKHTASMKRDRQKTKQTTKVEAK